MLAGFVEVGEAFEESVAREVLEEAGVVLKEGSLRSVPRAPSATSSLGLPCV